MSVFDRLRALTEGSVSRVKKGKQVYVDPSQVGTSFHAGMKMVFGVWRKANPDGSLSGSKEDFQAMADHHRQESDKAGANANAHEKTANSAASMTRLYKSGGDLKAAETAAGGIKPAAVAAHAAVGREHYHAHAAKQLQAHADAGAATPFTPDEDAAKGHEAKAMKGTKEHLSKHGPNVKDGVGFVGAGRAAAKA